MVAIGAIGFTAQGTISGQLAAWDLLPKDTATVELYFTEPTSLPTTYAPGKPFTIKATVHNASKDTKQYTYMITQTGDGAQNSVLREESLALSPDETKVIEQPVSPDDMGKRANFSVQLKENLQQINFWSTRQ